MGEFVGQVLDLTVAFNPWLLLAIFLMTFIAEFGVSIPLLMESVWLFAGYSFAVGNISPEHLAMFVAVGLVGRLLGGLILFYVIWYGKTFVGAPLFRWLGRYLGVLAGRYRFLRVAGDGIGRAVRWFGSRGQDKTHTDECGAHYLRLFGRKLRLSPVVVACGRFVGMRWPLNLFLSARKLRRSLLIGIAIFSVAWDAAYITFGVLGGRSGLDQTQMLFYPIGAIVAVSLMTFGVKKLRSYFKSRKEVRAAAPAALLPPAGFRILSARAYPVALRVPDGFGGETG